MKKNWKIPLLISVALIAIVVIIIFSNRDTVDIAAEEYEVIEREIPYNPDSMSLNSGLVKVKNDDNYYDFMNMDMTLLMGDFPFGEAHSFSNGLAAVSDQKPEEKVQKFYYIDSQWIDDDLFIITVGNDPTLCADTSGRIIKKLDAKHIYPLAGSNADYVAFSDYEDRWGIISKDCDIKVSPQYEEIFGIYNNFFTATKKSNKLLCEMKPNIN